jgi:hypothetical protein
LEASSSVLTCKNSKPKAMSSSWKDFRAYAIIIELEKAGVMISLTSLLLSPIWPMQKTNDSRMMSVYYSKFNQVVFLNAAVVPDVVSLLEQINKSSCTWYTTIDVANVFSQSYLKRPPESVYQLARPAVYF